ncbi:MAG: hemagglutinin, partial [Betaproteobacteria bacterium]|nr:hemagglutinin [Betaproteobacteria bacterium]
SYSFTPATALTDASHTLSVRTKDAAGNVSALSDAVTVKVDTGIPTAPTLNASVTGLTKVTSPTLTGKAEVGSTVTLYDATTKLATTSADATTGAYSIAIATPLADGAHSLTVTATDAAGNASPASTAVALTVDTVTARPVLTALASSLNTNKPTITGTAEANSSVVVYDGTTKLGTVTAGADGKFSLALITALGDGNHSITAQATDRILNVSDVSSALTFTVDTIAPSTPTIATAATTTNLNKPVITGTAEKASTVTVFDGTTSLGTAIADATTGVWTFTPATALSDGSHSLTAKARDAAGNISAASSALAVTVDTVAPNKPVMTAVATPFNTSTPTLKGTAEAKSEVSLYEGQTLLGKATADGTGAFSITLPASLTDGSHILTATSKDAAGNVSTSASDPLTIQIDTVAPDKPTVAVTGMLPNTFIKTNKPVITGTAEAKSTVTVYDGTTVLGTTTAGADGSYSFTPATALTD